MALFVLSSVDNRIQFRQILVGNRRDVERHFPLELARSERFCRVNSVLYPCFALPRRRSAMVL